MTHERPSRRVGSGAEMGAGGSGPARATVRRLRRNQGEDAGDPTDIVNRRRVV